MLIQVGSRHAYFDFESHSRGVYLSSYLNIFTRPQKYVQMRLTLQELSIVGFLIMNQTMRVIFAVILTALSFTYPANADSQKFNLRLKSDANLTGKTFANKTKRCGVNSAQSGDRHF